MSQSNTKDGGYYAIKGFTYQFDKSILEILENQSSDIQIEQIQDIKVDNYYIQVKHKETQSYSPSKIKPATIQLLSSFLADRNKSFVLYCYFKDRSSQRINLTEIELNEILGSEKESYTEVDKKSFIEHFTLEFSDDFEKQFRKLVAKIKKEFGLTTEEEATLHHSIFRANLIEIAVKKNQKERTINFKGLKDLINKNEKIIFELAHWKYLKNERYLGYLRKEYFTFRNINIPNKQRIFFIELDTEVKDNELIQIISNIKNRYFKKQNSPAPFICFLNIKEDRLIFIKQKLWDHGLLFSDGTHFNGDKFRFTDLIADTHNNNSTTSFKLLSYANFPLFSKKKSIDESFIFLTSGEGEWHFKEKEVKEFYVKNTKDIIKIIQ